MDGADESLSTVQPYPLAVLLCDGVVIDPDTGKKTLVGVFDRVVCRSFPAFYPLTIYVKLTDAEGVYRFRLDYVRIGAERALDSHEMEPTTISDRLASYELITRAALSIPGPATFEVRIYANARYLARATFEAVPLYRGDEERDDD